MSWNLENAQRFAEWAWEWNGGIVGYLITGGIILAIVYYYVIMKLVQKFKASRVLKKEAHLQ